MVKSRHLIDFMKKRHGFDWVDCLRARNIGRSGWLRKRRNPDRSRKSETRAGQHQKRTTDPIFLPGLGGHVLIDGADIFKGAVQIQRLVTGSSLPIAVSHDFHGSLYDHPARQIAPDREDPVKLNAIGSIGVENKKS